MSLNLEPGQTWRNRGGQFVTVDFKASNRSWYMKNEAAPDSSGYLVDDMGRNKRTHRSDLDLMERATRVYVSVLIGQAEDAQRTKERYIRSGCFVEETMGCPRLSITLLITCEMLVLMPGYETSPWSMLELHIAESLSLAIVWPE